MARVLTRLMTAEEFYDWANNPTNRDRHFELEEGEVVERPLPGEQQGFLCANSAAILAAYAWGIKRGLVTSNGVGIILARNPDTVLGADVALYLDKIRFDQLNKGHSERLPKLIVEAFSPTDRQGKMQKRINKFLEKGVAMVWLINPDAETLTIYLPNRQPIVLECHEEVRDLKLLPDFRCKVADFFEMPGE